jgi:hypothetical protein
VGRGVNVSVGTVVGKGVLISVEVGAKLVHRGGNKHRVFDAENMSGCYRKPVEDFRKRILAMRRQHITSATIIKNLLSAEGHLVIANLPFCVSAESSMMIMATPHCESFYHEQPNHLTT